MEQLSGMEKMWASFIAIGLMVVASLLISFARVKTKGVVKAVLSIIAFVILLVGILYMLISLM